MFQVFLKGLEVYGYHGVSPEEQAIGHRLVLDVTLDVNGSADQNDSVQATVDYGELASMLSNRITEGRFQTLERLADYLSSAVLASYPLVQRVFISLAKKAPPFREIAELAGVVVTRERNDP